MNSILSCNLALDNKLNNKLKFHYAIAQPPTHSQAHIPLLSHTRNKLLHTKPARRNEHVTK